ncbi:MAG TPA: TonB family protein [Bacteroidota bacterium]|nr:TonB family protein [Bacteroidota bacterium]
MPENSLESKSHYGMREIRAMYQKYAMRALAAAVLLHLAGIGGYYLAQVLGEEEEPTMTVRIMKYTDLGPPPSITNTEAAPQVQVTVPVAKPTVGVPVPVPDAEVNPEQTIASQKELSEVVSPTVNTGDGDGSAQIQQDINIEDEEPPDFVPFEKGPIPVKEVKPEYPEFAKRISAEGTVWIKIWVDKEGKPKKVVIQKSSDNEALDESAKKAAMQYLFTPAIMNNGPVAVWVSIPFRFKLSK